MRLAAKWRSGPGADFLKTCFADLDPSLLNTSGSEVIRLGQGEPIVIVPGLAGGWRLLAPLAHRLAERGFEAILCGLRGDHASLGPSRQVECMADLAADLDEVIESLRLERPTLMGVSFGGAVALEWAVANPHRLGGLVLHGVEARFRPNLGSTITRQVLERFPLPSDNGFLNQFFNILHGCKPEPGPLVDFVIERCWETDQRVMAQRLRALETFDVSERLERIDAPTLILAGSRDAIVPPSRQQALASLIPGASFVGLPEAGHIGFLTHGDEIVREIERLMSNVTVC